MDSADTTRQQCSSRNLLAESPPGPSVVSWLKVFPGEPAQVGKARHWIEGVLPDCDPREALVLIASEFCANAVEHTRSGALGGQFTVHLAWAPGTVRVTVGDEGSALPPGTVDATLDSEHGRGLHLVNALATDWGFTNCLEGRLLWADHPWPDSFPSPWNLTS